MATKNKSRSAAAVQRESLTDSWLMPTVPPATMEERVERIQVLGQRIEGYVQYMCSVGKINGTSAESKDKAVTVFYERLAMFEQELCRIQESLQLG